jgi:multiple sugar transport system substrate-binding protein
MTLETRLRRGAVGVLVTSALLVASACGGGSTGASDQGAPATHGGALTIANWQWLEPKRGDLLWGGLQHYTEVNPKAKLNKSSTPYATYADKLNTELGAGGGPDVMLMLDSQFATLAQAGLLEPLDDAITGAHLNATNEAGKYKGKQLAVSWERVNYALIWNKKILAKAGVNPPTTVDELISAGKTVKAKTGVQGFGVRHQMSEFGGWFMDYANWTYGNGGSYAKDGKLTLNAPANVAGVQAFKKVYDSGIMPIGDDMSIGGSGE